jgi:hypothetical protein
MSGTERLAWARATASRYIEPLGRRWQHVQAVAALARRISVRDEASETLVMAAYLHDVGYAPELAVTGFHPLDGARFLRSQGEEQLARLVAHHSNARVEARLRGIADYEDEFIFEGSLLDRALTYCDLSTSPEGKPVSIEERIREISQRYGSEHVTAVAVAAGLPEYQSWRVEVERLLGP